MAEHKRLPFAQTAWAVCAREWNAAFDSALAWLTIALAVLALNATALNEFFLAGRLELRALFETLPMVLVVLAPALGMRLWSEDLRQRTAELWLTLPVRTGAIVLGKYLALLGLYTLVLVGTLPLVILLSQLGDPPLLTIARGYLGALALGAALLAIAGFFSTLHAEALSAFVSAAFTAFLLLALGDARVMAILDGLLPGSGLGSLLGERVALLGAYQELVYAPSFDWISTLLPVLRLLLVTLLFLWGAQRGAARNRA